MISSRYCAAWMKSRSFADCFISCVVSAMLFSSCSLVMHHDWVCCKRSPVGFHVYCRRNLGRLLLIWQILGESTFDGLRNLFRRDMMVFVVFQLDGTTSSRRRWSTACCPWFCRHTWWLCRSTFRAALPAVCGVNGDFSGILLCRHPISPRATLQASPVPLNRLTPTSTSKTPARKSFMIFTVQRRHIAVYVVGFDTMVEQIFRQFFRHPLGQRRH